MTATNYTVTMHKQYPAWDEKEGLAIEVSAPSRAVAIKRARRTFRDNGNLTQQDGTVRFTAVAAPSPR